MPSEDLDPLDLMEIQWPVPGGTAKVCYRFFGGARVRNPDGSHTPREFMYVEVPDDPSAPAYVMHCAYTEADLTPRIVKLEVVQRDPLREIRSVDLRSIRLEDALQAAWLKATRQPATVSDGVASSDPLAAVHEQTDSRTTFRGLRARNRRRVTDDVLREVADVYRAAMPSGAPTKAVKEHFGLATSTASLYVKRARDSGLLDERS